MRKLSIIAILPLILLACQEEGLLPPEIEPSRNSYKVTDETLLKYFETYKGIIATKSQDDITIAPITKGNDTVMYIVNYSEGWEVLSADLRAPKVLIMCNKGHINEDILAESQGESMYFENLKEDMARLIHSGAELDFDSYDNWQDLSATSSDEIWSDWKWRHYVS